MKIFGKMINRKALQGRGGLDKPGGKMQINLPMRKRTEPYLLWNRLSEGNINCVGSNHTRWPIERKNKPSIFKNACGAPGVETILPTLFSEGVVKKKFSIITLSEVLSENPARFFKLFPKKGILAPGCDSDIVILDPQKGVTIRGEQMHSNAGYMLYEGI